VKKLKGTLFKFDTPSRDFFNYSNGKTNWHKEHAVGF